MTAQELPAADVAGGIGHDDAVVRRWFGVRGAGRTQSPDRFVIHIISELTIEHVGSH